MFLADTQYPSGSVAAASMCNVSFLLVLARSTCALIWVRDACANTEHFPSFIRAREASPDVVAPIEGMERTVDSEGKQR